MSDQIQVLKMTKKIMFHFEANLYGREIEVYLYKYIRPEMKFGSLEELKNQLSNDKQEVLNFLNSQVR